MLSQPGPAAQRTRVYTSPRSRAAHLLSAQDSPNSAWSRALCGRLPDGVNWYGTGSQAEYDTAAALPVCRVCARRARLDQPLQAVALP